MSDTAMIDQTLRTASQILIRCAIMGVAVLLVWWAGLSLMGDFVYRMHATVAPMSRQHFNLVHYAGMMTTKAAVSLLFVFPWIAIQLVLRKRAT